MKKNNKKYEKLIKKVKKLYSIYVEKEKPGEFLRIIKPQIISWKLIFHVKPTINNLLFLIAERKREISFEKYVKKYNSQVKKIQRRNIYWWYLTDIKRYFKNETKCFHGINLFTDKKAMIISCKNCRSNFDLFEKNDDIETHEKLLVYQGRSKKSKEEQKKILELPTMAEERKKFRKLRKIEKGIIREIDPRFIGMYEEGEARRRIKSGESLIDYNPDDYNSDDEITDDEIFIREIIDEITVIKTEEEITNDEITDEITDDEIIDEITDDEINYVEETEGDETIKSEVETLDEMSEISETNTDEIFSEMIEFNINFSKSLVNNNEPESFNLIDIFEPRNESNNLENINRNILIWNNNFYAARQITLMSIYNLGYYFNKLKHHFKNNNEMEKHLREIGIFHKINYINKKIKFYKFAEKYPDILKSNWAFRTIEKEIKRIRIFFSKKLNSTLDEF